MISQHLRSNILFPATAASVSTDDDNLWDINETDNDLLGLKSDPSKVKAGKKMTPEEFLGANAKLVDFDDLVSKPKPCR